MVQYIVNASNSGGVWDLELQEESEKKRGSSSVHSGDHSPPLLSVDKVAHLSA